MQYNPTCKHGSADHVCCAKSHSIELFEETLFGPNILCRQISEPSMPKVIGRGGGWEGGHLFVRVVQHQ